MKIANVDSAQIMTSGIVTIGAQTVTSGKSKNFFVDEFILARSVNKKTADKYRRIIQQVLGYFASKGITAPTSTDINIYISKLRAEDKSDYTLRLYSAVIKLFFAFLESKGYYPNSAANLKLHLKKSTTHNKKALTQNQAESLIASVEGRDIQSLRDRAIIALALTTDSG